MDWGVSRQEIRDGTLAVTKDKLRRQRSARTAPLAFRMEEGMQSASRKMKRFIGTKESDKIIYQRYKEQLEQAIKEMEEEIARTKIEDDETDTINDDSSYYGVISSAA